MSQNINYIPYYHLVNEAKVAKCQQNYDSAIACYGKAFAMVDYILIEDLRNFAQCAIAVNNDSLVYFAMERCNLGTIPLAFIFPSDSACERYKQTEQWNAYMAYEKENHERYIAKYFCPAKKVLDSLIINDQAVRSNKRMWYVRTFPKSKRAKKLIREGVVTDSCNQRVVDEVIQKYGFPNERIGCPNNYIFYNGGMVLMHYDDVNFFRNVEYKAFLEGKLSPDCYAIRASRMALIYKWDKLQYTYSYSKRKGKRMTPQEKVQVDKNRYEIGLPSIKDEKIIIQCNYQESLNRKTRTKRKK